MAAQPSVKRLAISKASAQVVIAAGIASFLTVFSLFGTQALWKQNGYLNKVNGKKEVALKQLQDNLKASDSLVSHYTTFVNHPVNVIGGSISGTMPNDGDNAKIVLDALPSTYDFPALTSSIEKILTSRNLKVSSITGTDDELAQQAAASSSTPQAVPINFSFSISEANYTSVQDVIKALQSSIRPIQVDTMILSGANSSMTLTVTAHTYFQPPQTIDIKSEVVK